MQRAEIPAPGSKLAKQYDVVHASHAYCVDGGEIANVNPFEVPRCLPIHVASVITLAGLIQTRRREKQKIAEVGIWQGIMSRWLLTCMPYAELHMIDPWCAGKPGDTWYDNGDRFAKKPQEQFDIYHALACQVAEDFAPRGFIHRLPSVQAAEQFPDRMFDLVFIDAAHDYTNVKKDIHAWRAKVRPGGYLTGHDYKVDGNYFGLIRGVNEATKELGLTIEVCAGKVWACRIP